MKGISSILGQDAAVRVLTRALDASKVGSAYLFEGTAGIGKATTAHALAQALNCERAPARGCGDCDSCRKIAERLHPDYIEVHPDGQFIKIAQVRQVTARAAYRPHEGRARLVVLDPADALNLEAANALLKTLEEPPADTHFTLVTAAPDRLPVTVRSRCQRVRFAPLATQVVADWLARERGVEAAQAQILAGMSGGSLRQAEELASGESLSQRREEALGIEQAVRSTAMAELLDRAAALKDDKENLPASLELLRVLYRDALLVAMGVGGGRIVHADLDAELSTLSALGPDRLRRRIEAVAQAENALRGNVNPQLCLERMMLRLREC
jgi:DNA polymerase-3 subunit delta'